MLYKKQSAQKQPEQVPHGIGRSEGNLHQNQTSKTETLRPSLSCPKFAIKSNMISNYFRRDSHVIM